MSENIEFADEEDINKRFDDLEVALEEMKEEVDSVLAQRVHYDKMEPAQKIEFDLFLAYALNSYYWVYLRINGIDPKTTPLIGELNRVKAAMKKWQEIKDRSKRPTVDVDAAKRFIKSGLYDRYQGNGQPKNKIMKFDDDSKI